MQNDSEPYCQAQQKSTTAVVGPCCVVVLGVAASVNLGGAISEILLRSIQCVTNGWSRVALYNNKRTALSMMFTSYTHPHEVEDSPKVGLPGTPSLCMGTHKLCH